MPIKNIKQDTRLKLPYKKFLDALVLSRFQMDEIATKLRDLGLMPAPTDLEVEIRLIMSEYKEEFGTDIINYPKDIKTLMSHLQNLPGAGPYVKQAIEILNDVNIRRWVNSMAMASLDPQLIYILVSTKTDKIYDEGAFDSYLNFFFNLSDFTIKDKTEIQLKETDPELKNMYGLALRYDKDQMLWKMGFTPDIPLEQMVKIVAVESVMRFKISIDEDKAARLGTLVLKAVDKLKELDSEKKKALETIAGFDIKLLREKPKVRLLKDLDEEADG